MRASGCFFVHFMLSLCLLYHSVSYVNIPACYTKTQSVSSGNIQETAKLDLYACNAVLMDGETGDVLYEKSAYDKKPNASTTKILTCILALECGDMENTVSVSSYASKMPEVRLGVRADESYKLIDMVYAMMLESYNDAAVVIAESIGGSVAEFADMMNRKAKEIGCTSTYFITPNGLDADDAIGVHGTSAKDLALIMRYCILVSPKRKEFIEICQTRTYSFGDTQGKRSFTCSNHNTLLNMQEGVVAGKTGFTCDAGYCYVGAVSRNGKYYIFSLLGCGWPGNKSYKWKDSARLIDFAEKSAIYTTLCTSEMYDVSVSFSSASERIRQIPVVCYESLAAAYTDSDFRYEFTNNGILKAPVCKGSVVGWVKVYRDEEMIDIWPVTLDENVSDVTFKDVFCDIIHGSIL